MIQSTTPSSSSSFLQTAAPASKGDATPKPAVLVCTQQSTICTLRARPPSSSRRAQITFEAIHFPPTEATQKAPPSSLRLDVVNCTKDVYNHRLYKMLQLPNMRTILEQFLTFSKL